MDALSALLAEGRIAEAAALARAMTERFPLDAFGWKSLGAALRRLGRNADALAPLTMAAALAPDDADANNTLGIVLTELGRPEEAEASYRRALAIDPDYAPAHNGLGTALQRLGRLDESASSYRQALRIDPGYAIAHNNLGTTLHRAGRLEEAEASYRRAIEIDPDYAATHNNLGTLLRVLGRLRDAETSFRQALKIKPDYAEACNNLGTVLHDLGRPDEAAACFRQAIVSDADYAEAHNNLALALQRLGRLDEAAASAGQALKIAPRCAEAHNNLGTILDALGRPEEAEASFRKALEIKPVYAEAHYNLGATLSVRDRLDGAEASYRLALQINPGLAEAHSGLGSTLHRLGRPREAEASCWLALRIKPHYAAPLVTLGDIRADSGQFEEAEILYRRALAIEPEMPEAWAALIRNRNAPPAAGDWLKTAERIAGHDLEPRRESKLRYALGKYYDDIGDFDRAFLNYRRANDLKSSFGKPYDRRLCTDFVDRIVRGQASESMHDIRSGASDSARPLFIVGMPRSGTSLIEQIVASHPAAFGAGELRFWNDVAKRLDPTTVTSNGDAVTQRIVAEACLANLARFSSDALRVADKMPNNFFHLGLIHSVFPNARILHAQRNPIDTCLSIYFQDLNFGHSYANDLGDLAHYYREYRRLMAHWRAALPPEVFLDVSYETLVEDQEAWSRKLIEFIGLDWDTRCLDFHKTERKVGTASNWQVRQKIYTSSKERWRNYAKYVEPLLGLLELPS